MFWMGISTLKLPILSAYVLVQRVYVEFLAFVRDYNI